MRQHQGQSFIAPKLPKALLDQVESSGGGKRRNQVTRKDRRKQEREQKKIDARRKRPRTPSYKPPAQTDGFSDDDDDGEDAFDSAPPAPAPKASKAAKKALSKPAEDADGQPLKSILKTTKKADPKPKKNRDASPEPAVPRVSRAAKDKLAADDAEIAALEKKLGIKKNKKKLPQAFADDGLDDLLDGLDGDSADEGKKRKRSEDEEWLKQKRRRVQPVKEEVATKQEQEAEEDDDEDEEDEEEFEEEDFDEDDEGDSINDEMDAIDDLLGDLGEDSGAEDEEMLGFGEDDDELSEEEEEDGEDDNELDGEDFEAFEDDEDEDDDDDDDDDEHQAESQPEPKRQRENPYIAPVTATTSAPAVAPAGKYVPPSLRGPPSSDAEALQRLRRQLQGLLNRLSEANLISILQSVEKVYADNPRQYVTSTFIDLLLGLICDRTSLQDTFLILHAGFIAALYKVIGIDFGAQVIERIVNDFDNHYKGDEATAGKETANLMSLLSELYNFGVVGGNLVFDYIRLFLTSLSEANTELLLKIIRNSGPQLRHEDPSALKDIVLLLQKQVTAVGEANLSVRTKFMIETINSLKNNRMKTGAAASAVVSEHTTRMKKTIGTLNNRTTLKASEPLRIGLSDIRDTDKKGKWWLVGASWMDPGKHETSKDTADADSGISGKKKSKSSAPEVDTTIFATEGSTNLLTVAREQGMNTDIRRAVFVTVMSASDFKDAHIRLQKLNFKKTQELEIPRVLIHCAGAEAVYNRYYTLIAKTLCGEKRMVKAFQFGLWDLFKRMGERDDEEDEDEGEDEEDMGMRKIVNLGKFFAELIVEAGVPITCLKTLNFAFLQPKTTTFLEVLLTTLILACLKRSKSSQWELSLTDVFSKAQDVPEMVQGLRYFVETVVSKGELAKDKKERGRLRTGCQSVVEALGSGGKGGDGDEDEDEGLTSGSDFE